MLHQRVVNCQTCRTAIYYSTKSGTMRFSPGRNPKYLSVCTTHYLLVPLIHRGHQIVE